MYLTDPITFNLTRSDATGYIFPQLVYNNTGIKVINPRLGFDGELHPGAIQYITSDWVYEGSAVRRRYEHVLAAELSLTLQGILRDVDGTMLGNRLWARCYCTGVIASGPHDAVVVRIGDDLPVMAWWLDYARSWATLAEMLDEYGVINRDPRTLTMTLRFVCPYRIWFATETQDQITGEWVETERLNVGLLETPMEITYGIPITAYPTPDPNPVIVAEPYSSASPAPGSGVTPGTQINFSVVLQKGSGVNTEYVTGPAWLATICRGHTVLQWSGVFAAGNSASVPVTVNFQATLEQLAGSGFIEDQAVQIGFYCGNGSIPYVTEAGLVWQYIADVPVENGTINLMSNIGTRCTRRFNGADYDWVDLPAGILLSMASQPLGEWTIIWNDVAGYNTPASQTKTLVAGETVSFVAQYTPAGNGDGDGDDVGTSLLPIVLLAAGGGAILWWAKNRRKP